MFSLIYGSKKADLMEVENTIVVGQSLGSVWGKEDEEWMVNKVQGCSLQQVPTNGLQHGSITVIGNNEFVYFYTVNAIWYFVIAA